MFSVISLLRYLQNIQLESLFKHARRTFSESPFNAFSRNTCLVLNTLNVGYLRCLQPAKYCHNLHLFFSRKKSFSSIASYFLFSSTPSWQWNMYYNPYFILLLFFCSVWKMFTEQYSPINCHLSLAVNAKVLGSIPASSDTVESEMRQMKQSWITLH